MQPERLAVGKVIKPHGIHGEVAVEVYSDAPDRFAPGACVDAERGDVLESLTVRSSRPHQGRLLVRFREVPDRDAAEAMRGLTLSIPTERAAPLPAWSFYPHELKGCEVVDVAGRALGTLQRVDESPANDLWVVGRPDGAVYVPAVRAIVKEVDLQARRIVLDPPEGLF